MAPVVPLTPGTPSSPGTPSTPSAPGTPSTPNTPPAPSTPSAPNTPNTPPAPSSDSLASATAGQGGGAGASSELPGVFGDLFGGAAVPVAFQRFNAAGQPIGTVFEVRNPVTGTFVPVVNNRSSNEALTAQVGSYEQSLTQSSSLQPSSHSSQSSQPSSFIIQGATVNPAQIAAATRIPTANRGTFKITENETPRPTTRAYVTYNFYDNLFRTIGENTPRIMLHQQNFGYEQAFANQRFSVGLRVPYYQLVSPGLFSDTSVGDLTIVTKAVISENRATGDLLSGGLTITLPTGSRTTSSFDDDNLRNTLLQPFLGYILVNGDVFLQGFSSLVVPTSSSDVLLFTQSLALGSSIYRRPGATLSGIYPVFEAHLNTPLNHRGDISTQLVSFPDNLTLLGGTFFEFYSRSTLGFAAGAPVTGPRPFSLQATVQLSVRF